MEERNSISSTGVDFDAEADVLDHMLEIAELGRRAEQKIYQREVVSFLNSFEKFADGLRLIRGRKNLIWFSTGFDARDIVGGTTAELARNAALIETGRQYQVSEDQFGSANVQHDAKELVDHLQSSGTVVFAIDTSVSGEASSQKVGMNSLNMFAESTGGKVYSNYSDLTKPLTKIQELTNEYYVLNFYPSKNVKKGKVGKLKVKVDIRPKPRIYTTRGIMVEPDFSKLTKLEKQIQLSEYIGRDQIARGVPLRFQSRLIPSENEYNLQKLALDVTIGGDYFGIGPGDKPHQLEIHALAITENHQLFDRSWFSFSTPAGQARQHRETGIKYYGNLFLKPGNYTIKIVARDMESGKIGSAIQQLVVTPQSENLIGPLAINNDKWILVRQDEASEQKRYAEYLDVSYPFAVSGKNLLPENLTSLQATGIEQFFFLLSGNPQFKEHTPAVTALIMDDQGALQPVPPQALAADVSYRGGQQHLTALLLQIDFKHLNLTDGKSYKLLTQFKTPDGQHLRSSAEFTVIR